ncbi:hypothetical protein [Haliangium sp.]|uniref:hypothetical protein n=1 Tax=Haliangium sp. TaxID=2663208 RepID=UPI003D097DA2
MRGLDSTRRRRMHAHAGAVTDVGAGRPVAAVTALITFAALAPLTWLACGSVPERAPDASVAPICPLEAEIEARPGFPFEPQVFRTQVWPVLSDSCALSGCHLQPEGAGGFTLWPVSTAPCDFAHSFNAVYDKSDFRNDPKNSRVYASVTGSNPAHPALADSPDLDIILDYVSAAYQAYIDRFGPSDPTELFDFDVFQTQVQPVFDEAGCIVAGCHAPETAAGGFSLYPAPTAGSAEMEQNFATIVSLVDFSSGQNGAVLSRVYVRASDLHRGVRLGDDSLATLLSWIQAGLPPGDEAPGPGCADPLSFDLGVFRDEIMPVLRGDIDLNDPGSGRNTTGCTRGPCHGTDRGPNTLYLPEDAGDEDNLRSFACYVDAGNPSRSQILACPLNASGCAVSPHPGEDIFSGVKDRNYQRLLAYLYASASAATPLDFAFFVRRVNPLFDSRDTIADGERDITCASTNGCHGTLIPGQPPANFSNFGLLADSTLEQDLTLNFISAANFTYFPDPDQSSLLLYPTNEIANLENPLATGLPHPGGTAFATTDPEADIIRTWAGGLRPDDEGFQRFWLVAGDFPTASLTDAPIPDEATITPRIFDASGQTVSFNAGKWDGYFSDSRFIDLNDPAQGFHRDTSLDRITYALAYLINTSSRDIDTLFTVSSPNDVEVLVDDQRSIGLGGNGVTVRRIVPSYASSRQLVRIMVKVFQHSGDDQYGFELQLTDAGGTPLTAQGRELVIKLGPEGGI